MVRAGTDIESMPSRAAILSCVASPISPSDASVPAPPPSMATKTRPSHPCRRSISRHSSLTMGSPRQERIFGALRQRRQGSEDGSQLLQEDMMRLPHLQELPGLG